MEIIERAKTGGEVIAWNESEENVKEEALRRNVKAGYCNSEGGPVNSGKIMTTVAFGRVKYNLWPRDENGQLVE